MAAFVQIYTGKLNKVNRENTKDRDQVQTEYVDWFIDGLDIKEMMRIISDQMHEDLDMLDDVELVKEVKHYAPDLVDNITLLVS